MNSIAKKFTIFLKMYRIRFNGLLTYICNYLLNLLMFRQKAALRRHCFFPIDVKVKVVEVDLPRKRIALTMRLDDVAKTPEIKASRPAKIPPAQQVPAPQNSLSQAFAKAGLK